MDRLDVKASESSRLGCGPGGQQGARAEMENGYPPAGDSGQGTPVRHHDLPDEAPASGPDGVANLEAGDTELSQLTPAHDTRLVSGEGFDAPVRGSGHDVDRC